MTDVSTLDELTDALRASYDSPVLLFKHSATCPISSMAHREIDRLTEASDPPVYRIVVQRARQVSSACAEQTGIRHESPQALVVRDGEVVWHASHHRVRAAAIRAAAAPVQP